MRLIRTLLVFVALLFVLSSVGAVSINKKVWVCWYNSVKNSNYGTYAWSNIKSIAKKKAKELCEKEFDSECKLEYCEKVVADKKKN